MLKKIMTVVLTVLLILTIWQLIETFVSQRMIAEGRTSIEAFIPTPSTMLKTIRDDGDQIIYETGYTLARAVVGFSIGIIFGIAMAILIFLFPALRQVVLPIAFSANSFPIVGFAPVIILLFGQGSNISIIFISTLIAYFPVLINIESAFMTTNSAILDIVHVFGATRWQVVQKVMIPLAFPNFLNSLRLALPASIIGATMGEWLGARNGIGQLITVALYQLKPGLLYTSLLTVAAVSLVLTATVHFLTKYLTPWVSVEKN